VTEVRGADPGRLLAVAVVVGIGLGIFSILADGIVGGRLIGILGNIAAPWGLAAFLVGLRTTSLRRGAIAGGLALVVGVATYYLGTAVRGYVAGAANVVWTVVALVTGPIMGTSGAAISARRSRPPLVAVAAPAAMLVGEALFFLYDRRVWRYDLVAQPYRFVDLGVAAALLALGLLLPALFVKDRRRRARVYLLVAAAGVCGAVALVWLQRFIVAIV